MFKTLFVRRRSGGGKAWPGARLVVFALGAGVIGCGGGGGSGTTTTPPVTNAVTGVSVSPNPAGLAPGATQQFAATVTGTGTFTKGVTWAVNGVAGGNDAVGTITSGGLYVTPFPVPTSVTVTATSTFDTTKSGSATVNLNVPTIAGPSLAVDASAGQHAISPLIYGMNAYGISNQQQYVANAHLPLDRFGGDATTEYNYLTDTTNTASDYYFEVYPSPNAAPDSSQFNGQVYADFNSGAKTLGTMPMVGYVAKAPLAGAVLCGFSVAKYGAQQEVDPYHADCGNGKTSAGNQITGNDPTDTSIASNETFDAGWVQYLVNKFGTAANGGVAMYDLDNEPEYWSFVHVDVHPTPLSYDELTQKGISYAAAIKAADPTAAVNGPVIAAWTGLFYSPKDWYSGWSTGPNYVYNGNPVDRLAHGNVPLVEYYLQQMAAYDAAHGQRLLDYLDLHGYYAAPNAAFATAGTTDLQAARLNSTRAMWDPTYQDAVNTDPNDTSKTPAPGTPMLIRQMKSWIAKDYPGTKTGIDEYNWGAQESINGAVAQADLLGIFGREGLDMAALWGAPDPTTQLPGLEAFLIYRDYDGNGAAFGDMGVQGTSTDETQLAIYPAVRTADNVLTMVVVNKSFNNLTSTIALSNVSVAGNGVGPVAVWQYSNANLKAIVAMPSVQVLGNTVTETYPAQSITVLAVPMN